MEEKKEPHYDLDSVKGLVRAGQYGRTNRVARHMRSQGWGDSFLMRCFEQMTVPDIHKSQQHRDRSGQWLDIYRPWIGGQRMYVKFTVDYDGGVVVMSLCRDGEEH